MRQLLLPYLLLLTGAAQAQTTFAIGPRVGYNRSTSTFSLTATGDAVYATSSLHGFEAGLTAAVSFGHFSLEPSLVYTRKGFARHAEFGKLASPFSIASDATFRLNYFAFPLNVAYSLKAGGQGAQVFAGPYIGLLLGGTYDYASVNYYTSPATREYYSGDIVVGDTYSAIAIGQAFRRVDVGVQGGLGYRLGGLLLQATYSLGLKNTSADYLQSASPTSYNRVFQVSAAYLFGPKQ